MKKLALAIIFMFLGGFVFSGAALAQGYGQQAPGQESQSMQQNQATSSMPSSQSQTGFVQASKIIGEQAKNAEGHDIGKVKDLIFSDSGQLQYIALSKANSSKVIPVPFSAVQSNFQVSQNRVVLGSLSKNQIDSAPAISENDLASLHQGGRIADQVNAYFGTSGTEGTMGQPGTSGTQSGTYGAPSGTYGAPGTSGSQSGTQGGMQSGQSQNQ